jgi:hypothetical protein
MPGPVFPSEAPRPAKSRAERRVWECLEKQLPNGWTAWHSLRIRVRGGYLGEGDFVLAHPQRGLLVLEVKGGTVEQRDGRWTSNGIALEVAPLDQGRDFLRKLVSRLAEEGCQPPAFGAAVAFPDTDFDAQPDQDDLRGVVIGRRQLAWLAEALPAVVARALPPPRAGAGAWMKVLHRLWGETWIPQLSLGSRVAEAGERRLALDEVQLAALQLLSAQERALIHGGAGSGKTLLAVEAARRQAAAGRSVLLLCSTQPLQHWLAARLDGTGIDVETVSGLAQRIVEAADGPRPPPGSGRQEDWTGLFQRASDLAEPRWDSVIIDEAQDFPFEAWAYVEGLSRGRRLWAFLDPVQRYWPERSPPAELFGPPFVLGEGRRSPPGIAALADRYAGKAGDEAAIRRAVAARELALVPCADPGQTAAQVGRVVDQLRGEGIPFGDIGVVSLRGQTRADAVHHAQRLGQHAFVRADAPGMEDQLVADSFLRWKGLERPVIIVADVDPAQERFGTRMHIALTRALAAARVVAPLAGAGEAWPGLPAG